MIEKLTDLPPGVVGLRASGRITARDYETVLIPAIEAGIKEHGAIRLLYILESSLANFSAGAMWDDAKVGFAHLQDLERVALVSDSHLVRGILHAFHFVMPKDFEIFARADEAKARDWITEGAGVAA